MLSWLFLFLLLVVSTVGQERKRKRERGGDIQLRPAKKFFVREMCVYMVTWHRKGQVSTVWEGIG